MTENEEIVEGKAPDERDLFYLEWGRETLKANLKLANDVLRQLVTLNAVLLGGGIAFLGEDLLDAYFRIGATACFFVALVTAFVGMMPYEAEVHLDAPSEIKAHKEQALKSKRLWLWVTGFLMATGFGVVIAGAAMRRFV